MVYVMRVVAFANGDPCPIAGHYLKTFDVDAYNGTGLCTFTDDPIDAMHFANPGEVFEVWNSQSTVRPLRPDGRPNKPLTSTTISVEQLDVMQH